MSYIYPYQARTTCFSDYGEHNQSTVPLTFVQVPLMQGCHKEYRFGEYDKLVHYDSFFERVLDESHIICGISGKDICMDISNMKTSAGGKKYVVSNQELPHKKIASFALAVRPVCMNVLEGYKGDQLHLYQLETDEIRSLSGKKIRYHADRRRLRYEYLDKPWRNAFQYAIKEFLGRIRESL